MSGPIKRLPAICDRCGAVFLSSAFIRGRGSIKVTDSSMTCPKGHRGARIPNGIYESFGNTLKMIFDSPETIDHLKELVASLEKAKARGASSNEVKQTIKTLAPDLAPLAETAPKSKDALRGWITTVCTLITCLITVYVNFVAPKSISRDEAQAMIEKEISKTLAAQSVPTPKPTPKAGGNRQQRRARAKKQRAQKPKLK